MSRISRKEDLTNRHKWGILTFGSIHTPGDERSRTHPGHGYPESWDSVSKFDAFDTEVEWKEEITRLTERREAFKAFTIGHVSVSTTVSVAMT